VINNLDVLYFPRERLSKTFTDFYGRRVEAEIEFHTLGGACLHELFQSLTRLM